LFTLYAGSDLGCGKAIVPSNNNAVEAYKKYYVERDYEQVDLWRLLRDEFGISKVIYPGSYIQISPSFIFPFVVYIDSDKNAIRYFQSDALIEMVNQRKEYPQQPEVFFHGVDYRELIDDYYSKFDLLISQYAGFISNVCKPYLRRGGYLLVNNSHGDAGMASINRDYKLISVVHKTKGKYRLSNSSLDHYFIPKKSITVTKELLLERKKGVGYTKTAPLYIFQKTN
jgi:hypothetical protein